VRVCVCVGVCVRVCVCVCVYRDDVWALSMLSELSLISGDVSESLSHCAKICLLLEVCVCMCV